MDPLTLLLQAAFYLAFAVSLARWLTRRGPLELAVVAVFAPIAALFALSLVNGVAPSLSPVLRPVLIFILFLQPWCVVHLVGQLRPVAARISWLVLAGGVLSTAGIVLFAGNPMVLVAAVTYFFVVQIAAAGRLAADSRRRIGVARIRLVTAAVATALFGTAILFAGVGSAATGTTMTWVQILTRTMALAAGIGYLLAFIPPDWLRRQAYRAMAFDLMRGLVAPGSESGPGRLWADLAAAAREILGARRVMILSAADGLPLATVGDADPPSDPVAPAPVATDPLSRVRRLFSTRPTVVSRVEVALRPPGGEHLVADVEGRPLFVEDDIALLSILGSLTARAVDREEALITLGQARNALEESAAIKASEARFRALLDADPNAVLALDARQSVVWATRQAGELFGAEPSTLVGTALADLVALPHDQRPHDQRPSGPADRPILRADTTGRRLDGTQFPAELAQSSFELDGEAFQLAVVSDVSWRHEAAQIRDRFLGVLSHELRTPVTSIYGGTQLLLARGSRLDEATKTELLASVAAESERLQRMIENLVALARIERGADIAPVRPVLLDRVIRDLIERERRLWPELTINYDVPHPVQMVSADEEYLGQIVRNLLSNAAKYSGSGSTIDVEILDSDSEVFVTVRDNGPGIDESESDKLFSLYYRAAHQAAVASGAGIGLFICRELVSIMGGRMWAKPRPEGGAEFGFSLPAYVDEPEPAFETSDHPAQSVTILQPLGTSNGHPAPAATSADAGNGSGSERRRAPAEAG